MENKQQKSKDLQSRYLAVDKKSLIQGSIIATILALTPFLFTLYESVPREKTWDTFLFTYYSGFFENANTAMWIFTGKAIPLLLIFIWFFTNRHWWYHVLLVPIAMYIYQIIYLFYDDRYLDQFQLIYMVPVMAVVIPSIYLIRARIFNRINDASKSLEELEEEFKVSPKNFWDKVKQYF
ncbi:hypothetical protein SAMN05421824_1688 [Hyunsoonleella jejuensis]|uniref:Uncharacterized protein n=1 Tax=Hyunsoonleella jejuensis TaxID=419940 RepID=A0A1H9G5F0_9FLAO|nr:hypothetical protein [Hyunsoonleella jejuensis]SEQ45376.1 hypothetical protein SAMN05421824_1688 [Hyunsoonleella jejuensis]